MQTDNDRVILPPTDDDLDELVGFVGAEANHEPSRRRQQRLDVALDALTDAQTNLHDTNASARVRRSDMLTRWPCQIWTWCAYSGGAPPGCPSTPATRSASNARSRRGT